MKRTRNIVRILLITLLISIFQVGCSSKENIEDNQGMSQAIAKFLEVDRVELCGAKVVEPYSYLCFYYEGETKEESGYSYAAFRRKASGAYVLEFAQLPSKLIPMAKGIGGAYFDDHMILVSSNEKLDKIKLTGEIEKQIRVDSTPYIYAIDIFQGEDIAKQVKCQFFDEDGHEIK